MGEVFTVQLQDGREDFQRHEGVADAEAGGTRLQTQLAGTLNVESHTQVGQCGAGSRSFQ